MEKIFSGKTLEEAKAGISAHFSALGIDEFDIATEIIEQPVKKLFGGFKGEFKIKAVVDDKLLVKEEEKAAEVKTAPAPVKSAELAAAPSSPSSQSSSADTAPNEKKGTVNATLIVNYLTRIITQLGAKDFRIDVIEREDITIFDIVGDKMGIAIGRRGETLDSLQYLAILANNRSGEAYSRISVDCNGYREKRNETLESLAIRTAKKVLAQGRRVTLEPMNPYERRIIHGKVAEIEGVYSNSIGEEPYRKVVISANVPKHRRDNNSSDRDHRGDRGGNRGDRRRGPSTAGRSYKQSSGFSTSFEREYKREKAEPVEISQDTVDFEKNSSLGKIEL